MARDDEPSASRSASPAARRSSLRAHAEGLREPAQGRAARRRLVRGRVGRTASVALDLGAGRVREARRRRAPGRLLRPLSRPDWRCGRPARSSARRGWRRSAAALWWRKNPSACPYGQRFWVEAPHPVITRKRLLEVARARARRAVLEIGPGTGYYTFDVADAPRRRDARDLRHPAGDARPRDARGRRARASRTSRPTRGDAQALPYDGRQLRRRRPRHRARRDPRPGRRAARARAGPAARAAGSSWASCSATRTWSPPESSASARAGAGLRSSAGSATRSRSSRASEVTRGARARSTGAALRRASHALCVARRSTERPCAYTTTGEFGALWIARRRSAAPRSTASGAAPGLPAGGARPGGARRVNSVVKRRRAPRAAATARAAAARPRAGDLLVPLRARRHLVRRRPSAIGALVPGARGPLARRGGADGAHPSLSRRPLPLRRARRRAARRRGLARRAAWLAERR